MREIWSILETEFIALPSHCWVLLWFLLLGLWDGLERSSGWICTTAVSSSLILRRWLSTLNTSLGCTCLVLAKLLWSCPFRLSYIRPAVMSYLSSYYGRWSRRRCRENFVRIIQLLVVVVDSHFRKVEFSEAVFSEIMYKGELQAGKRERWVTIQSASFSISRTWTMVANMNPNDKKMKWSRAVG